jgi:hypothetical protein
MPQDGVTDDEVLYRRIPQLPGLLKDREWYLAYQFSSVLGPAYAVIG